MKSYLPDLLRLQIKLKFVKSISLIKFIETKLNINDKWIQLSSHLIWIINITIIASFGSVFVKHSVDQVR